MTGCSVLRYLRGSVWQAMCSAHANQWVFCRWGYTGWIDCLPLDCEEKNEKKTKWTPQQHSGEIILPEYKHNVSGVCFLTLINPLQSGSISLFAHVCVFFFCVCECVNYSRKGLTFRYWFRQRQKRCLSLTKPVGETLDFIHLYKTLKSLWITQKLWAEELNGWLQYHGLGIICLVVYF